MAQNLLPSLPPVSLNNQLGATRQAFGHVHTAAARPSRSAAFLCALGLVAVLSACGGGGGGGSTTPSTTPDTSGGSGSGSGSGGGSGATAVSVALSGTAATGAPVASATVNIKCSSSAGTVVTGSATTDADGAYTASVAGASVPCLLQVQLSSSAGGGSLHSLASAAGVANLTPLTNAIVATTLDVADPSSTFATLDATKVSTLKTDITQGKHTAAWTALKAKLTAQNVDTSAITGDPITQAFKADIWNVGQGLDKVLDDTAKKGLTAEHLYRMAAALPVPPTGATGQLNDTGVDWCSQNLTTSASTIWEKISSVACTTYNWGTNLWGQQQDAYFGRDAQAKAGTLTKVGGGMAGFDFTKIGADGKPLAVQNGTYSNNGTEAAGTKWDCVRDNVTGLIWEVKRNDANHLRHMGHKYAWYKTYSPTQSVGYQAPTGYYSEDGTEKWTASSASTCTGVADVAKCNTQSYAAAVNAAPGLCGKTDWRMPTLDELLSLAHAGRIKPAIDTDYFPNTANFYYWSSLLTIDNFPNALTSGSQIIGSYYQPTNTALYVRLVRSGQ